MVLNLIIALTCSISIINRAKLYITFEHIGSVARLLPTDIFFTYLILPLSGYNMRLSVGDVKSPKWLKIRRHIAGMSVNIRK